MAEESAASDRDTLGRQILPHLADPVHCPVPTSEAALIITWAIALSISIYFLRSFGWSQYFFWLLGSACLVLVVLLCTTDFRGLGKMRLEDREALEHIYEDMLSRGITPAEATQTRRALLKRFVVWFGVCAALAFVFGEFRHLLWLLGFGVLGVIVVYGITRPRPPAGR